LLTITGSCVARAAAARAQSPLILAPFPSQELEVITRRVEAAAKEADDLAAADAADEEVAAQLLLAEAAPRVYLVGPTPDGVHRDYLGAYDRQEELVNDRLAYAMAGNADNMLWFSNTNGYWHAGPRANLGSPRGWLAVFDRTPLPERILAEWQVGAANAGWTPAPEVRCLAGMAGEAAFAAMSQVQGTIPAALEEAATNIYLVGDTGEGVNHKYVGAYARGAQIVNGRFTYSRVGEGGDPMRMLWYCSAEGGQWWAGPRNNLGTAVGWLAVHDKALAPEDISATWRAVLRDGGWLSTPKLRCLVGEAGEGVHLQEVEAQRKRELDETHELLLAAAERVHLVGTTPYGAHRDYLGAYDRETELVNGRPAYAMAGNVDKMLWFSSVNGYWHAGPRANLGGPRGWLAVYDRAPLPERVTGEWQVGAADSSWTAAPDVRCLVANPPQQPTAADAAVGFPEPRRQDDARPRRARTG